MALGGALRIKPQFLCDRDLKTRIDRQNGRTRLRCGCSAARFVRNPALSGSSRIKGPIKATLGQNSSILTEEQGKEEASRGKQSREAQFMFHAQENGQVRVFLQLKASKYFVKVEASLPTIEAPLLLHWGLFRSDSADWVLLEPENAPSNTIFLSGKDEAMQTPFQQSSSCSQTLEFELSPDMVPFYISFVLYKPASHDLEEVWIRSKSGLNFCVPVGLQTGRPHPLGFTLTPDGSANFALYSKNASTVTLCLYQAEDTEPAMEIDLDASAHRTGDIWHVQLPSIEGFVRYGYRCKGEETWENGNRFHKRRILLDPYAKFLAPLVPGQEELPSPATALGFLRSESNEFAWLDDSPLCIPLERVFAYRLDVAGFTSDSSSRLDDVVRGTFVGVIEKIQHLKTLGVNAVILQPIFSYDKPQGQYYPISFFSPMDVYDSARSSLSASTSFKEMVKSLHSNGIEVILDVVYTHTAENGDKAPETISFRGIDNQTYYVLDPRKRVMELESGETSTNVFNCNDPAVHSMIVDSLRYWTEEYHVDGFCFVNAAGLLRGPHGENLSRPLLVEAISFDPVLAKSKLIADVCSPVNSSVSKRFQFPHWKRWCELNTSFCNDVNDFLSGRRGKLSDFATRICGSADIFSSGRNPSFSFNHVSNSYGRTLRDSVICSDTMDEELGKLDVTQEQIQEQKNRQIRNLLVTLFLSQGVPVLSMGDEYGNLNDGKPGKARNFEWTKLENDNGLCQLISSLSSLRSSCKNLLQKKTFIEPENIVWHGTEANSEPLWTDPSSSFLAVTLKSASADAVSDLFIAFNAGDDAVEVALPELPKETTWLRIVDTSFAHPETIILNGSKLSSQISYNVEPFTVLVLQAAASL